MLSVICPVYNEAENINNLLQEICCKISVPLEILIVYDDPRDNTIEAVLNIREQYPFGIRLVQNTFGAGALNAIKTGFNEAKHQAILVVMADLSDDLAIVDEMYKLITNCDFDIVCGSRYMPGGRQIGGPFLKRNLSRLAGISLHYLSGIPTHDVTNSFKMYRREIIENTQLESNGGFEIGMELVVKAFVARKKITEIPSVWHDRTAGESRFRMWRWLPNYLRWYFYAFSKAKF